MNSNNILLRAPRIPLSNHATKMATAKSTFGILAGILLVLVLAGIALSWRQARQLRALRSAAAEAAADPVAKELARANQQIVALNANQTKAASAGPKAVLRSSAAVTNDSFSPGSKSFAAAYNAAMEDPQFRALMAKAEKARLNIAYSQLFKKLGLPPEQLNQFEELLIDKQQSVEDAIRSGDAHDMDRQSVQKAVLASQEPINADIHSLLGEDGYAAYQNYEETRGQRTVVDQLRQDLTGSENALTDDKASQLVQLFYQESPINPDILRATAGLATKEGAGIRDRDYSSPIPDQLLTQAQAFLSPAQLDALRQLQAQQSALRALRQEGYVHAQ
jgi:hypothetical protein